MVKCPSCPCVFETEFDLKLHLDAFGKRHYHRWKKAHKHLEFGIDQEHGGADRIVRDLVRIISPYNMV